MQAMRNTRHHWRVVPILTVVALGLCPFAWQPERISAAEPGTTQIRLSADAARPLKLTVSDKEIPLAPAGGGFAIHDVKRNMDIALGQGSLREAEGRIVSTVAGDDLEVEVRFTPEERCLRVEGEIRSRRAEERALILRYVVPVRTEKAVFWDEINSRTEIGAAGGRLGTVYPIAAMCGDGWGVALAIPPSFPCCFGMTGTKNGIGVEFYLGLSPETKHFPNSASFSFLIYPADPAWGFRSALAQYYELHPDYYTPRIKGGGMWLWQEKGDIEHALDLFRFQAVTHTGEFEAELERNRNHGVLTLDYIIVGQLEIKRLATLPKDYDDAMRVVANWVEQWKAEPTGELRKRHSHWRDRELPEHIERCACKDRDGRFALRIRSTVWGGSSITFRMNPNPLLFEDKKLSTVGGTAISTTTKWLQATAGVDGIYIDSLGSEWPGLMNHRRDHYPYARYPLTFDPEGNAGLHNRISHYEFVEELRRRVRDKGKLIFANGIYRYRRVRKPEYYNGNETGRFFLASLLDGGGREEVSLPTREMLDFYRTCMGRRLYATLLYKWEDAEIIRRQLNRALPYAVFATPIRSYFTRVSYLLSDDGYKRDKDLLEWFVKHCRLLHDAGWEPVTHARVSGEDMVCERYGNGDTIYFALVNFGETQRECVLTIDLSPLGFSPEEGNMFRLSEIARNAPVAETAEGDVATVRLPLKPEEAHIIKLERRW